MSFEENSWQINIMSDLSNLTIIIPSYNRQPFIKRQIAFWKNTSVEVVILDGSQTGIFPDEWCENNIRYYHKPVSLEDRLKFASTIIRTEYATMLSDDELFVPSALEECLNFLDNNPDYVACKGQVIGFRRNSFISRCQGVIGYTDLRGYEVTSSIPAERLLEHMSPYAMASLWAVHRADVLKKTLELAGLRPRYSSAAAFELQISLITAWYGKIKVLDRLMWLRSRENRNIWWSFGNVSTIDWLTNKKYKNEIEQFVNDFSFICEKDDERLNIVKNISLALNEYSLRGLMTRNDGFLKSRFYKIILEFIWNNIGERSRVLLRRIMKIDRPLLDVAKELSSAGVFIDFDELDQIDLFLINYKLDA